MKVLVTGAAGYIGSVLTPMLLRRGCEVIALDNFMYKQTALLDYSGIENFQLIIGDTRNEKLINELLKKVDCIIPLACIVGALACDRDPTAAQSINLEAIRLILKYRSPHQMIIYPNTNSGYGIGQEGIYCDEDSPLNPISLYGQLKVQAEKEILFSGNTIALRLATVFGMSPRIRLDLLVNDFVYRALTDRFIVLFEAHFKRNYIHISDVARAFIHCYLNFDDMRDQSYNVGLSDANLSKWELCQEIKKQIPDFYIHKAEIGKDPDQRNYIVSNSKIERTKFFARTSLQEGIAELIKGLRGIPPSQFRNA